LSEKPKDKVITIVPKSGGRYALDVLAGKANLAGTVNPVTVEVSIGDNSGITSVNASFVRILQ
jgi:hypothetical protein